MVEGNPIALARVRYSRGNFYDSQKNLKLVWGISLSNQHNDEPLFVGPIWMDIIFYLPIAKKCPGKLRQDLINNWHLCKPDISNLCKFLEDVCIGICYEDDCLIAKETIEKVYDDGNGPRTEFTISELPTKRS
jgi:Holliday junction resolvase RusA-like endonuclease